jgi:hypothetical protein
MNIRDFLGHSSMAKRGTFLKNWKDRGFLHCFIHTRAQCEPLWRHPIPVVKTFNNKDTGRADRVVWTDNLNCHETEETLQAQYFRDKDTGAREVPPEKCGVCRMVEYVRDCVETGAISWTTPLFRFVGDDPTKARTLYAAGLYGGFTDRKNEFSPEQREELGRLHIYNTNAWQYNLMAKLNYGFAVLDADNVSAGIQITVEPQLLGDKVKEVIKKEMISKGEEAGDPWLTPYCFRWESHDKEREPNKRYDAMRYDQVTANPAILQVIRSAPPEMGGLSKKFNPTEVRANLEQHALVALPWDEFFPPAPVTGGQPPQPYAVQGAPTSDIQMIACDNCKQPMPVDSLKCVACGQEYAPAEDEVPPAPPPPPAAPIVRRRGGTPAFPPSAQSASPVAATAPQTASPARPAPVTPAVLPAPPTPAARPAPAAPAGMPRPGARSAKPGGYPQNADDDIPF